MILRPPISTRTDTLFPYTTLFRSSSLCALLRVDGGYSILPALAAGRVEDRDLVFRELIAPALTRKVYLVTRKLRSLSPSSELLPDAMRATLHDTPIPPSVRILDI